MNVELLVSAASVVVAAAAMSVTSYLLIRQNKHLEQERNALAILEAINRLTDASAMAAFEGLEGVHQRYPTDEDILSRYDDSDDDRALLLVAQYFETIATLARRNVLDPSLLVDAIGYMIRVRWGTIREFIYHLRRVRGNDYIFENFEWLAMYSAWWRQLPRPPGEPNYDEKQFAGITFEI